MSPACRPACAAPASELLAHVSEHPPSVSLLLSACITPHLPSAFQHCKLFTAHNTCWVIIVDHQMAGMICRRPTQPWSCNRRLFGHIVVKCHCGALQVFALAISHARWHHCHVVSGMMRPKTDLLCNRQRLELISVQLRDAAHSADTLPC